MLSSIFQRFQVVVVVVEDFGALFARVTEASNV
jgi:hypothetical protein